MGEHEGTRLNTDPDWKLSDELIHDLGVPDAGDGLEASPGK